MKYIATFIRPIYALARVSTWEMLRSRLLYSGFMVCMILLTVGFLAARLSFIQPERILMDFGISAVSICLCAIAILFVATLIPKEVERKTLFIVLSRPVSRTQLVLGQYLGLSCVVAINWLILTFSFLTTLVMTQEAGLQLITRELGVALLLVGVESLFLGAVAVCFSTFSTPALACMFSVGTYLVGSNAAEFKGVLKAPAQWMTALLPNLEYFHLGTKIYYRIPITSAYFLGCLAYGVSLIALFLWISCFTIRTRELQ